MPGPCRPIEFSMPLGVSAIRGVGRPDRGASMTDLVTTAPSLGHVEELGQLPAGGRAAGGGEDRVGQLDVARAGSLQVDACGSGRCRQVRAHCRPAAARPSSTAGASRARRARRTGSCPRRPSAPAARGTPARPRRTAPSGSPRRRPTTGSTQVMQTPMPQAMDSSTGVSTGMSYRLGAARSPPQHAPSGRRRRSRRCAPRG